MQTNSKFQKLFNSIIFLSLFFSNVSLFSQNTQRPFIWVKQEDKAKILKKIEEQEWAKSYYTAFKNRVDKEIAAYKKSPEDFLKKLPLPVAVSFSVMSFCATTSACV